MNDGGQAFPIGTKTTHKDHYSGTEYPDEYGYESGMSLRDWFAGQALVGILASYANEHHVAQAEACAMEAYLRADAMLKARENNV